MADRADDAGPVPDLGALSPEDEARLAELVASVLADDAPGTALGREIAALDAGQKPALIVALFEAVAYRVDTRDYWLQFRMWKSYRALGAAFAPTAFAHGSAAVWMHPDFEASGHVFSDLFRTLLRRGRDRAALDLFHYQMRHLPGRPAARASDIAAIERRLGAAAPTRAAGPGTDAVRLHPVFAQEARAPLACALFGGAPPESLLPLLNGTLRPAITAAEFTDAEVLIQRDSVVVLDRFGAPHEASCVAEFPEQMSARFACEEADGLSVPLREVEEAVLIADRYPTSNLCHVLYDHLTRLAIYQRLGVDTGRALVIGAEPRQPPHADLLRRAGVTAYLGTEHIARVRARRLWVSSNCRALRHAAHIGADWAVQFMRHTLGGRGAKGWRRLYLSRADVAERQVANEAEVIALLDAHGFEPIMPGRMPYDAQLAAFRQASHIVAPHGAALAHIVLCPPGAQVLEIFHPLYGTAAYAMQAEAAGIGYAAMLARDWESDAPHWNDPSLGHVAGSQVHTRHIRVDLAALAAYLATLA